MKMVLPLIAILFVTSLLSGQTNRSEVATGTGFRQAAIEQELQALEQTWAQAVKQRDTAKINNIQAEEFEFTGPAGQIWTKARAQETIKTGQLQIDSFEMSEFKIRIYGDTAVVNFRVVWNGNSSGVDISGPQRMTDVFVKRVGRWQCVASQATRISSQPAGNDK